jgi:hypothetical protein
MDVPQRRNGSWQTNVVGEGARRWLSCVNVGNGR